MPAPSRDTSKALRHGSASQLLNKQLKILFQPLQLQDLSVSNLSSYFQREMSGCNSKNIDVHPYQITIKLKIDQFLGHNADLFFKSNVTANQVYKLSCNMVAISVLIHFKGIRFAANNDASGCGMTATERSSTCATSCSVLLARPTGNINLKNTRRCRRHHHS